MDKRRIDRTRPARFILHHLRRAEHELHLVSDHAEQPMRDNVGHVQAVLRPLIPQAEAELERLRLEDDV
jgi:hypothetical protein